MVKRKLRSTGAESVEQEKENKDAVEASELEPQQPVEAYKEEPETLENEKGIAAGYDDLGEEDENPAKKVKEEVQKEEAAAADLEENGDDDGEEEELEDEPVEKLIEPFSKEQLAALVKEAVERYPDFADSVLRVADADPAHRKVFVHGLGWDTTSETLISVFGKYGKIEDCKAVIDKNTGKSKGYAFILFKHRSGAKKALLEPQKKIGVRMTSCQLASAGPVPNHGHTFAHAPPLVATVATVAKVPPVSEYTQRKIFVSNVAADIDPGKLLEFFKQFGEVEDGPLGLDKQTSKPKGFALFVYKTVESARKALEEPHKIFEGHTLHCQRAVDGPKNNKFQNQQQQHYKPNYNNKKEKHRKYQPRGHAPSYGQGHLMAPTQAVGSFNPAVAAQAAMNPALGQALTALIASQGANMGLSNLLGLGGPPMNQTGTHIMHNASYVNPGSLGFGTPQVMQGGYQNLHIGNGGGGSSRPPPGLHMGGPPYTGS